MSFDLIHVHTQSRTSIITIDRPQNLNALNLAVFKELKSALLRIATDDSIRSVIITGQGQKSFVAGADISEFETIPIGGAKEFLHLGNDVMNTIENFSKPILAAINGFALGGGLELAMACHVRWASHNAKFGMPEINLGILPGYGGTQRLPRLIGKARALEMMLTGEMINADKALEYGLINQIVSQQDLMESVVLFAEKLNLMPPISMKNIITCVNGVSKSNVEEGISLEGDLFTVCADTQDFKEGVSAFFQKRKANFTGN